MKNHHYRFLALLISCTLAGTAPMSALGSESVSAGETASAAEETSASDTETAAETEPGTGEDEPEAPAAAGETATGPDEGE